MITHILVIWTIVGFAGTSGTYRERDWRPVGEFQSAAACQEAIRLLNVEGRARCVPTK